MKFNKLSKFFLLTLLVNSSTFFELTSCNVATADLNANIIKSYEQFISDRTFSLVCGSVCRDRNGNICGVPPFDLGTGWIIDKVTPLDENDFRYYVATNLHVVAAFEQRISHPDPVPPSFTFIATEFAVGDRNYGITPTRFANWNNFTWLSKEASEFKIEDIDCNFVFFGNNCIDMSVCSIDFSRATWETKNKLIRLNNFRKENGYINKFVDSDDVSIIKKDKYVGGYPLCGFVPTWQFHRISGHDLRFSNDVHYHHSIGPNSNKLHNQYSNYIDTSFQYVFNKPMSQDWLGGGASGSMLITQDYEVCGILWGCKRLKNGPCWPCFSLFKTSQYDFIFKWLS